MKRVVEVTLTDGRTLQLVGEDNETNCIAGIIRDVMGCQYLRPVENEIVSVQVLPEVQSNFMVT